MRITPGEEAELSPAPEGEKAHKGLPLLRGEKHNLENCLGS